ncbi:hypothetical protein [Helicobacter pylori]
MQKASHNLLKSALWGVLRVVGGNFQNASYPLKKMNLKIKLKK